MNINAIGMGLSVKEPNKTFNRYAATKLPTTAAPQIIESPPKLSQLFLGSLLASFFLVIDYEKFCY